MTMTTPDGNGHFRMGGALTRVFEHWFTAVAIGIVVLVGMSLFSSLLPMRVLERLGADAVSEHAARSSDLRMKAGGIPIVMVTIDDGTMNAWGATTGLEARQRIAGLIQKVRLAGPRVLVVDIAFDRKGIVESHDKALVEALTVAGPPTVLAAPLSRAFQANKSLYQDFRLSETPYPSSLPVNVQFAASLVQPDADGVVRTMPGWYCVRYHRRLEQGEVPEGWRQMMSIGHQVLSLIGGGQKSDVGCTSNPVEATRIFYLIAPSRVDYRVKPEGWIRTFSAIDLDRMLSSDHELKAIKGAIVLLGQTHRAADDDHLTPLDEMPGVTLHANVIASLLYVGRESQWSEYAKIGLEFLLILVAATANLLYWATLEVLRRFRPKRAGTTSKFDFSVDIVVFVVVGAFTIHVVAYLAVEIGAVMLLHGMTVGTLVPAVAVVLEGLIHLGGSIHRKLSAFSSQLVRILGGCFLRWRRTTPSLIALVIVASGVVGAVPCSAESRFPVALLSLSDGSPNAISVQRSSTSALVSDAAAYDLFEGDRVEVTGNATVVIFIYHSKVQHTLRHGDTVSLVGVQPPERQRWPVIGIIFDLYDHRLREKSKQRPRAGASRADLQPIMNKFLNDVGGTRLSGQFRGLSPDHGAASTISMLRAPWIIDDPTTVHLQSVEAHQGVENVLDARAKFLVRRIDEATPGSIGSSNRLGEPRPITLALSPNRASAQAQESIPRVGSHELGRPRVRLASPDRIKDSHMAASSEEGDAIRYHIVGFGRELSKLTTSSSDLAILIDIRQQLRVGAAAALRRGDVDRTSANEIAGAIVELRLIDIMSGITEPGNGRIAFAASRAAGYCSHGVVRDALFTTSPFDAGSTVLSGAQMGELDQVAEAIHDSRVTDVMFQVEGHADSTGSEPANEAISLQRAQSVRRYLTTVKNINPASMVAVGRGSLVPLTVAVKGLEVPCNRTVQIRIQQDTSPPSR